MNIKIVSLVDEFQKLKAKHATLSAEVKKIGAEWDAKEAELLEAFIEEGVNAIKIEGVGNVSMRTRTFLSVTKDKKEQCLEYLRMSGNGGLIKDHVADATLTSFLDGHLIELTERLKNERGLDDVEARNAALAYLEEQCGAKYFTKRGISSPAIKPSQIAAN